MPPKYDLFVSYPHKDQGPVRELAAALRAEGLAVWMDESDVGAFERIHDRVAEGIADSRAVLAWYSRHYAASRPCQWELSAAWLCEDGDRILVVNPEPDDKHIRPRSLVHRAYLGAGDLPAVARHVKSRVARYSSAVGDAVSFSQPLHYGRQLAGSNRFVGRSAQFWAIHDALTESGAAMLTGATRSVVQLRGFGGVGKSVLAEEYALRFGAAYPGGVFWLKAYGNDARDELPAEEREGERLRQLTEFASRLHIPTEGKSPSEIESALGKVLDFGASGRRSLWIVDDVPSGLSLDALSKWLSPHASVPTLITTRDRRHSSLGRLVDVDVLSAEESFALLETHRRVEEAERPAARELLDALGHHALAVEVAGSYLGDQRSVSFAEFLGELHDPDEDVLEQAAELEQDALPLDHSPSIVATLKGTIDRLSQPARDLLCLASCLAAAPIPKELTEAVFARLYPEKSARFERMKAVNETDRFALSRTESAPADALSVHTLVARTARRHPGAKGRLESIRPAAVAALSEVLRNIFSLGATLRQGLFITHARALAAPLTTPEEAVLLVLVANTDLSRGDLETGERLARRALEHCRAVLGEDSLATCHARSGLAMVYLTRGDAGPAHEILAAVAPVFERSLPPGDPFRVGAQLGLGYALASRQDLPVAQRLAEAARIVEGAIAASAAANGPDHSLTLAGKTALGRILHALGDLAGAARQQQEVMEARRRVVDGLDVDGLMDEFLMAQISVGSGGLASSAPVIEKAEKVFAQELGEENILTLNAKLYKLILMVSREEMPEALRLARETIPHFERILGAHNPLTLHARCVEAMAFLCADRIREGLSLLEQIVPEMEAVFGADHPELLAAKVGIAEALHSGGDIEAARRVLDAVIPVAEARHGPAHAATLNAKGCLARCLSEQGDHAGACRVWEEVVALEAAAFGADHPEVLNTQLLIAQSLARLGQLRQSAELLGRVIPLAEARLGPEHDVTQMLKTCLTYCHTFTPPEGA